jgi:hypothetical protein
MKMNYALFASLLAAVFCFAATSGKAAEINAPLVAGKLGITVQQVKRLEEQFQLTHQQLLEVPYFQLTQMLDDLENPNHKGAEADLFPAIPDPSDIVPTFGERNELMNAGIANGGWTWLGPGNIGGRSRSILIHPTNTSVMWCGGVGGGVWKTTNNAASWYPLSDFMGNLAIGCMAMDPTNANIIYAGTGEATYNADSIRGAGIFKTLDGGTTWSQLANTANANYINVASISIDPNNGQVLLVATRTGLFRSVDGGASWTIRISGEVCQVQFHPTNSSLAVASGYGKTWYSSDGGVTWTLSTGFATSNGYNGGRIAITYARSAPTTVYASYDSASSASGQIYISLDGGHTYTLKTTTSYQYLGQQGWYDNVIWVDPTTTNLLVVGGGPDLWRSTDGGATLTQISQWASAPNSAHADHHAIVAAPNYNGTTVKTVYFGNDGGIYRAADVSTVSGTSGWQELNNNLGITQFYGGAGNASSGVIVGGTQDNGTLRYTTGGGTEGWTAMFGGDGGFAAADQTDPNYFYGEYVYLKIHRSSNAGVSSSYIYTGITDAANSTANFISPFILDPNNANTMLAGGNSLWRSVNVKAASPTWASIKAGNNDYISAIAVAPGNSDLIWVGHNSGAIYSTTNGTSATPTWVQRNTGLPGRTCTRIAITPGNSNKVYAVFMGYSSGNVWRTLNGGTNWASITGNLPSAPMNCIVLAPNATNTLYVASEVGVYGSSNDGTSWSTSNDGPANVSVNELFWMSNKLVAVTHGRGMWSITPALGGPTLVAASSQVSGGNGNGLVDPNECNALNIVIQNNGGATATLVSGVITTATPGLTIIQGSSAYPNVAITGTATNNTPFRISTSAPYACGAAALVNLVLTYNGGSNVVIPVNLPPGGSGYSVTASSGGVLVPGTTDIGLHIDDGTTNIALPFTWSFYGQNETNATLSSNGNLQFGSSDISWNNSCLPYAGFNYAILPLWDDLRTDTSGSGIFTSISGSAPNRIFNIEWRATYLANSLPANFEIRLYEGQARFDIIYATVNGGTSATAGIQSDTGSSYTNYSCNSSALTNGLQLTFQPACLDGGGACTVTTPILIPSVSGTNLNLSFATDVGRTYILQYRNVLTTPPWVNLQTNAGNGSLQTITVPTTTPAQRFFRLDVTTP